MGNCNTFVRSDQITESLPAINVLNLKRDITIAAHEESRICYCGLHGYTKIEDMYLAVIGMYICFKIFISASIDVSRSTTMFFVILSPPNVS